MTPDIVPQRFRGLTKETQRDLIAWRNSRSLTTEDYEDLAALVHKGQFQSWDCPACSDRVYEAWPDDWDNFQGVLQTDRVSYPGTGEDDRRCDFCRCHNKH